MATTTNYGWTTPDNTDLVKDGALAIRTLGSAIDTSMNTALGTKKAGMVLLNTTSFSGVSSFSLPANTFSSTYDNYLVSVNFTSSSTTISVSCRLRASGSDLTAANYDRGGFQNAVNSATLTALNANGQTAWSLLNVNGTSPSYTKFDIVFRAPNTTNLFKTATLTGTYVDSAGVAIYEGLAYSGATQADSASFIANTGNFTGSYSVYGFNK